MAARASDPIDTLPMVGDIVERNVVVGTGDRVSVASPPPTSSSLSTQEIMAAPALRPIRAVVGQAFPLVHTRRSYGRQGTTASTSHEIQQTVTSRGAAHNSMSSPATAAPSTLYTGLSAHVQPQDKADTRRSDGEDGNESAAAARAAAPWLPTSDGGSAPMLPAGGSAQQHLPAHQWSAAEFEQLRSGYYVASLPPCEAASFRVAEASAAPPVPSGEDFFNLLFQCVRSTVRKHQQFALEVLLAHLQGLMANSNNRRHDMAETASATAISSAEAGNNTNNSRFCEEAIALRKRCLHGPNCGPFLFFILEVLISAGHPAMVELAVTCLLLLLRGLPRGGAFSATDAPGVVLGGCDDTSLMTDAMAELGNPTGDVPNADEAEGQEEANEGRVKKDLKEGRELTNNTNALQDDDAELPFSEVSELLRGPDPRYGLEQLGFTNKVLATMQLLLRDAKADTTEGETAGNEGEHEGVPANTRDTVGTPVEDAASGQGRGGVLVDEGHLSASHGEVLFLELLLCGGVGVGHRTACRRVAEDPCFLRWMESQLSAVVLGERPLEGAMELLCVLQHLAHTPVALRSLIRGGPDGGDAHTVDETSTQASPATQQRQRQRFHETWLLFFIYVSSTAVTEVRTVRQVFTIVWSILLLRLCARQDNYDGTNPTTTPHSAFGLVHDMSDTLLTEGMAVGSALVLEMWFLHYSGTAGSVGGGYGGDRSSSSSSSNGRQPGSLDGYFLDAARTALRLCRKRMASNDSEAAVTATVNSVHQTTTITVPHPGEQTVTPGEAAAAQSLLRELQWLSNAHFLATYVTQMRQRSPATCYTLCGSATETQEVVQYVMRHVVMDATRIRGAFARLTTPLLSPSFSISKHPNASSEGQNSVPSAFSSTVSSAGQVSWVAAVEAVLRRWISPLPAVSPLPQSSQPRHHDAHSVCPASASSPRNIALLRLACEAAALYANTRVATAFADVYPAVTRDVAVGYAGLLTHAYEEACLRLRDGAVTRLQVDELCTMAEAVQLLQRYNDDSSKDKTGPVRAKLTASNAGRPNQAVAGEAEDASQTGVADRPVWYDREARIGAFFLLHSIAISKHCLDVVPLLLPLLQFRADAASSTMPVCVDIDARDAIMLQDRLPLLASLQSGIELTPVPVMLSGEGSPATVAVTGAPRSWVMYPLYDNTFTAKHLWAEWLRSLLGLHHRVKDVVGWDGVLSHTLLWMLTHRRALWTPAPSTTADDAEEGKGKGSTTTDEQLEAKDMEASISPASAKALCALAVDLCGMLRHQFTPAAVSEAPYIATQVTLSAAASRTLEISLAAYSDAPSEEGMPLLLHCLVGYFAAHCSARAALAALQLLLITPALPLPADDSRAAMTDSKTSSEAEPMPSSKSGPLLSSSLFSYTLATSQVCAWLQSWSAVQGQQAQSTSSVYWSLDDVVALLQLVGPHLNRGAWEGDYELCVCTDVTNIGAAWNNDELWCVRRLTEGLLRYYLHQRVLISGALSAMEKTVLRSTLEELEWHPPVLWTQVGM